MKNLFLFFTVFLMANAYANGQYKKTEQGVTTVLQNGELIRIDLLSPTIVKIAVAKNDSLLNVPSLIAKESPIGKSVFSIREIGNKLEVKTDSLNVILDKQSGNIEYKDLSGNLLMSESARIIEPYQNNIVGKQYRIQQNFKWAKDEILYGLGQHELKELNMRNHKIILTQQNTRISVPVILSTKGYGLYWDNYSRTIFNDVGDTSNISSDVADKIQYYFIKGSKFDQIIASLRALTGESPMPPRWAFGYFQSRNRYQNRKDLMDVVKNQRELNIPLDAIILDYLHWGKAGFGSMVFDSIDFPDAQGMIKELHDKYNCKLIVSVWPSFKKNTPNWNLLNQNRLLLDLDLGGFGQVYDAFNPKAGELYWSMVKKNYWDKGVDGIWFDATEPEQIHLYEKTQCYLGPTAKYLNLFSYFDMKNVYESQLKMDTNRVFILTRSSFLGQQKYGTVSWSGDVGTDFKTLKEQITSGLNFCMTGIPYWNTDIGGYLGGDVKDPKYQEVFVRWFQYGAFTPMFRAHGRREPFDSRNGKNELWSYGKENQKILTEYVNLRYRLLPYIYSLSHKVSAEAYTMMRSLAFDFLADKNVYEISDQFMFGESFMVCPVLEKGAVSRNVYLPKNTNWFDFGDGKVYRGGQTIKVDAPIERMPLFVKAGSIIPMAEMMQYSSEKRLNKMELRIYPGADGAFSLYEDEGDNYNYTKGMFTQIPFSYSHKTKTLTIGEIQGSFSGMLKERTFDIVLVNEKSGTGVQQGSNVKQTVEYKGAEIKIKLN